MSGHDSMDNQAKYVIDNRYQVHDKLGSGGMGHVYRVFDRLNRNMVALKRVVATGPGGISTEDDTLAADTRLMLAHEFQTLASLRHPNIISVLDYGFDEKRESYFTMTLLENPRTIVQAGQNQPLKTKVELLVQMLQALSYLHRRGVIHRDLKPDNVLVTVDDEVRVLDFGLAVLHDQSDEADIAGSLPYMAPEILQGMTPSREADLYAVGIIATEILAGRHPFDLSNTAKLIQDTMFGTVDMTQFDVGYDIAYLLESLLEKNPGDRIGDANEVINRLLRAVELPAPKETVAIRESFLQAAQFIGREQELASLSNALRHVMNGTGSAWLVGGESGVGKSRLLDEIRTRALVRGALVLNGQGVAEGGLSYQIWREPLRRLLLSTDIDDADAGVLKQIIPDISDLLERDVTPAPELEGQAGQQRLLNSIVNVFRNQSRPIVLIIEDLHWTIESKDVLRRVAQLVSERPLLVIGNYRDDESTDLPDELPEMRVMKLERLSDDGIRQLSTSMLGEAGESQDLVDLLKRESEGNVFFVVEVVRALAEEAGRLSDIGKHQLPSKVFAGGIEKVVQRRLDRLPEEVQPLLNFAAVAGRQLDLDLLRAVDSSMNVDEWLTICSNAAVFDVMEEQWRFAHDKLREGILNTLSDEERKSLNKRVADAMATVHVDALDEYSVMIADHYEQAEEYALAGKWHLHAGQHARKSYVPVSAIHHYQKALSYWDQASDANLVTTSDRLEIYNGLGSMLNWQARYAEASEVFEKMRTEAIAENDAEARTKAELWESTRQFFQGEMQAALENLEDTEVRARAASDKAGLAQLLFVKGWCLVQLGNFEAATEAGRESLKLSDDLDRPLLRANSLNLLGSLQLNLGNYPQAAAHFEEALKIYRELGDRGSTPMVLNNLGVIAEVRGDYLSAIERYQQALDLTRQISLRDGEMLALNNLSGARVAIGAFTAAENDLRELIRMAESAPFGRLSATYRFLADALLGQQKLEEALEAAQRALELGREFRSPEYIAAAWRVLGKLAAANGKPIELNDPERNETRSYDATVCFAESERVCSETGMKGERARTLRAWAEYAIEHGERESGLEKWRQARDIFAEIGADKEVERMAEAPQ